MDDDGRELIKRLRSKCQQQLPQSQTYLKSDVNDDVYNEVAVIMRCHDELKNVLRLANEKNDRAKIKLIRNKTKHQQLLKELNILQQKNKTLEENISNSAKHDDAIEKIKEENEYFQLVQKKNASKISQLKEEMARAAQMSFDKPPLVSDPDDSFMGFDSVTMTRSEKFSNDLYDPYRSFYYKIKEDTNDFQNSVDSLWTVMKETNSSIKSAIEEIDLFTSQITHELEIANKQCTRVLQNDHDEVIKELMKKRLVLEQIKLNSFSHLRLLELDLESLGNRVRIKRVPVFQNADCTYNCRYLKKQSVRKLYRIWIKLVMLWWPPNLEDNQFFNF